MIKRAVTEHNFEIEGQGIEQEFESNLQPGETNEVQVDLQPGTYTVYCPVDGHREQGMELSLTVEWATPSTLLSYRYPLNRYSGCSGVHRGAGRPTAS